MATTFDDFFRSNYDDVLRGVRASGATDEVAADATQEAFIRAFPRWWRLRHYQNPAAWVQRVAINICRDLVRSQKRYERVLTDFEVEARLEPGESPDLGFAMAGLPDRQREALEAYYHDGMSTAEAAEAMGISAGAVRFHLSEARSSLRPVLVTHGYGQEA